MFDQHSSRTLDSQDFCEKFLARKFREEGLDYTVISNKNDQKRLIIVRKIQID